jgi:hypothetical protein
MRADDLPEPEAGMVVRFQYQWADGKQQAKDRPACIAVVRPLKDAKPVDPNRGQVATLKEVVYLPISTKPPKSDQTAIKIPASICSILGLRESDCWVVVSECNVQYWANDINRVPDRDKAWYYGFVPPRFFEKIKEAFRQEIVRRSASIKNVHYLPPGKSRMVKKK